MNKRAILISVSVIVILGIIGVITYINKFYGLDNGTVDISNSKITNDGMYIEKGLEKLAIIAKPAVENYANQDTSESIESRNERLGKYFSSDSPVYTYTQDNIGTTINKTSAKITSITSWPMEGEGKLLIVTTETTLFDSNGSSPINQTYWVILNPDTNGLFVPYDIGIKQ